jgi:hypothetical protein
VKGGKSKGMKEQWKERNETTMGIKRNERTMEGKERKNNGKIN